MAELYGFGVPASGNARYSGTLCRFLELIRLYYKCVKGTVLSEDRPRCMPMPPCSLAPMCTCIFVCFVYVLCMSCVCVCCVYVVCVCVLCNYVLCVLWLCVLDFFVLRRPLLVLILSCGTTRPSAKGLEKSLPSKTQVFWHGSCWPPLRGGASLGVGRLDALLPFATAPHMF